MGLRFHVRHLGQHRREAPTVSSLSSLGQVFLGKECRHLLRNRRVDQLVDRYAFLLRDFAQSAVEGRGQTQTQRTHCFPPITFRNSWGVSTRIPKLASPVKSRRLCVTTASAPAATATSATMSSFRSRKGGRPQEKNGCVPAPPPIL